MQHKKTHSTVNRRQAISKISQVALGATGFLGSLSLEYQKPTLRKLLPLKNAAAMADSQTL